ncbi:TauD Probable taurine catabolism dioxygenase [Burkholderiaceae bacterium]
MNQVAASRHSIKITPLDGALGANVEGIDFSTPLNEADREALEQAWTDHLVLRFRGVGKLSADDLIKFSKNFGNLDARPISTSETNPYFDVDKPEITIISNVLMDGKPIGGLGAYEAVWHSDMTYVDQPPKGSCLYAVELPPSGGDTYFTNMYDAYETLSPELKEKIKNLFCIHDASRNSAGELRKGFKDIDDPTQTVGARHPLVRLHPVSQRQSLFLGRRRGAYIPGLSLSESEDLLNQLWAHVTQPKFSWGQKWQLGDMVLWDNRCTMHRREAFDTSSRRLMLRTQISGEKVLAA